MKRKFFAVLVVFLLLFLIGGCATNDTSKSGGQADNTDSAGTDAEALAEEPAGEEDEDVTEPVLLVAYSIDEGLMLSVGFNAPRPLTGGHKDYDPLLSPDGSKVMFKRVSEVTAEGQVRSDLWLVNADGTGERLLVEAGDLPGEMGYLIDVPQKVLLDRIPLQISWLKDGSGILFNTCLNLDYSLQTYNDLWFVPLQGGTLQQVLRDGTGGSFALSPDNRWLMVADHGSVSVIDLAEGFNEGRVLLDYSFVNTASEIAFTPQPVWAPGSDYALVAIPEPDPFGDPDLQPEIDIWQLFPAEQAEFKCTVYSDNIWDAMTGEMFSPDGQHFAYITGPFLAGQTHIARLDGTTVNTFDYVYDFMGWSRDGSLLILYTDIPYLAGLQRPQEELPTHEDVGAFSAVYKWVSADTYVGLDDSYFNETPLLWVTTIDGPARLIDRNVSSFDALLVGGH